MRIRTIICCVALAWLLCAASVWPGTQAWAQSLPADQPAASRPAPSATADAAPTAAPADAPSAPDVPGDPPASQPASAPASQEAVTTAPANRAVTTLPIAVGGPIVLNFVDAPLDVVLQYLSEAAGLVVVRTSRLDARITIVSRQPVSTDEAVALLDTALNARGYAAVRNGRTLKIVTIEQARRELIPVRSGNDPTQVPATDRIITQVIPIRYADATKLKTDLASLVPDTADLAANAASNSLILTSTESNVRRVMEIIRAIDVTMSEVSQVKVFQLKYANASNAARLITDLFRTDQTARAGQAPNPMQNFRRFMRGGGPGGMPGMPGGNASADTTTGGGPAAKVTASADDRTNALVVSAPPDLMKVIEDVVKGLDANPAEESAVFVYRVRNGQASNLESVLNNLFGWSSSRSSGTATGFGTASPYAGMVSGGLAGRSSGGGFGGGAGTGGFGGQTSTGGRNTGTANRNTGGTSGRGGATSRTPSAGTTAGASDLTGQVYVVADPDSNSLLVTTGTKNFERVKAILADLDRPIPQVLIKVLIAEVTHSDSLDLGMEFSVLNLRSSGQGQSIGTDFNVAGSTGGLVVKLLETNVEAAIRAIAGTAKLDVLSRPYILTSDNQEASILVGQEVPFVTNTRTTDTGQTINTIEYDDIGIILNVTPHINPQGLVTLDVYPEISTLTGETVPISETLNAPVFAKRSAQSRVAILDGQTIVIGGLMEDRITDTVSKVPLLGDIPGLGALFRRTIKQKSKTELLIFLTPHVAKTPENLTPMSRDELQGAPQVQQAVNDGSFQEHMRGMARGSADGQAVPLTPAGPGPLAPAGAPACSQPAGNDVILERR